MQRFPPKQGSVFSKLYTYGLNKIIDVKIPTTKVLTRRKVAAANFVPGIPGCLGRFVLKYGGGQIKNGAVTGSISQIETLFRLSPAVDSSQPTCSSIHERSQGYSTLLIVKN